jgi:hypothetical protein
VEGASEDVGVERVVDVGDEKEDAVDLDDEPVRGVADGLEVADGAVGRDGVA